MQMALTDPEHGYYMRRDPFGGRGDFITAPEVSQVFGELIGLFLAQVWEDRGRPKPFRLVELGPGRGTLMADALRAAAKVRPGIVEAAQIALVEASRVLRGSQAKTLADRRVQWADDLAGVPDDAPLFLVANEFFDALPIRQFVRSERGWHERRIGAEDGALRFVAAPDPIPITAPRHLGDPAAGAIFEASPAARATASAIGQRIGRLGGVALIVDYGHRGGWGDTLQAVRAHGYADPLTEPGEADLTAHVDFGALCDAAGREGARVSGPIAQGEFLEALGIRLRGAMLKRAAPQESGAIDAAIDRLTRAEQMGHLFKVLGISAPETPDLPGFPC
jgi:NADH dehydrogenase [ubiquinone] 1 alpha subcomplex assembly factor 7